MILFILFIVLTVGTIDCSDIARDELLSCFQVLLDTDKADNIITEHELDVFVKNHHLSPLTGKIILDTCDTNKDNYLTVADWAAVNSCVQTPHRVNYFCKLCKKLGWTEDVLKNKKQ